MNNPLALDFISDDDLRIALDGDWQELNSCFSVGAHKSVLVLSGSIIEAAVIDHIIAEGVLSKPEALKLELGAALDLAHKGKLISKKCYDLSSVVRNYRNLIHPGRLVRLAEKTDADTASVALALVRMIVSEIAASRQQKHGYTASQIIAKLKGDTSAISIIGHLLDGAAEKELRKLATDLLPSAYKAEFEYEMSSQIQLDAYESCFRAVYSQSSASLQLEIQSWFVHLYKEGADFQLDSFGTAFLRISDFPQEPNRDVNMIVTHLLTRLSSKQSNSIVRALKGIGPHLKKADVDSFVDPLVRLEISGHIEAHNLLYSELLKSRTEVAKLALVRLKAWRTQFEKRYDADKLEGLNDIIDTLEIPF